MSKEKHEALSSDYPLPVVGGQAVQDVLEAFSSDAGELVKIDLEPAFNFLNTKNPLITMELGLMLQSSGYNSLDCVSDAKKSLAMTHALLHAQARIDRGLPGVDMNSDEYFLPVVTEDTMSAYFAGATERQRAAGVTSYEELVARNEWIPRAIQLNLGLGIGAGGRGSLPVQAAEIAAIGVHGMLLEQAGIDVLNHRWGDTLLG